MSVGYDIKMLGKEPCVILTGWPLAHQFDCLWIQCHRTGWRKVIVVKPDVRPQPPITDGISALDGIPGASPDNATLDAIVAGKTETTIE